MRVGGGILGKLISGVMVAAGGLAGNYAAGYIKTAVPQASVAVTSTKGINLAAFGAGVAVGAFAPKAGVVGSLLQGVAGGLGGGSDPAASVMGGGSVRYGGVGVQYGSVGV